MLNELMNLIKEGIYECLKSFGWNDPSVFSSSDDIVLEIPKDKTHGDYATNTAMRLARVAKKKPFDIAQDIVNAIDKEKLHLSKVEIAGPGFINLTLDNAYLLTVVNKINEEGFEYGKLNVGENKKICLEFVSANPTGYLHIGHGRGAAYGDSLARIMNKAGYNVHKHCAPYL